MKEILIATIPSLLALVGVVITVYVGNKNTQLSVKEQVNLTLYRIEQLEKKQDKHNSLIERMYAVEDRLNVQEEKMKVANHRIDDLENKSA
jgi:hypothetical protein